MKEKEEEEKWVEKGERRGEGREKETKGKGINHLMKYAWL